MGIPEEITKIISLNSNGMIWIYILIFFVLSYLLVSLLTWSFLKPLKYLGIPTMIVGFIFLIIRFSATALVNLVEINSSINLIKVLLPSLLKPMLTNGLICLILGIIMTVLYNIINKKHNENKKAEDNKKI